MTEPPPVAPTQYVESAEVFITTDEARLLRYLMDKFGRDRLFQFKQLLDDVITTGYGDIKVVVVDRRVALIKVEKSYK